MERSADDADRAWRLAESVRGALAGLPTTVTVTVTVTTSTTTATTPAVAAAAAEEGR